MFRNLRRPNRNEVVPPSPVPRVGSLPFVSGDTFRQISQFRFEAGNLTEIPFLTTGVLFAEAREANVRSLVATLDSTRPRGINGAKTLVIHNGDWSLDEESFGVLSSSFHRIFATNILHSSPKSHPLPIGLENAALEKNGRLGPYLEALESPVPASQRTRQVLSTFHESTNVETRTVVASVMRGSRFGHEERFRRRSDYRREVQHTKFVISPPGNGIDCHRTWEAIYLGAVPVVLKGFLAHSLTSHLPIHVVDRYEDFVSLSDSELDDLYEDLRSRPLTKAWGHYWLGQILG